MEKEKEIKLAKKIYIGRSKSEKIYTSDKSESVLSTYAIVSSSEKYFNASMKPVCYTLENNEKIKSIVRENLMYTEQQDDSVRNISTALKKYKNFDCDIEELVADIEREINICSIRRKSSRFLSEKRKAIKL